MWIVFGSTTSVAMGLLVAVLADRSRCERTAKSMIFLPMAISFVGAGVIWNFMYEVRPAELPQIGLLNAIVVGSGRRSQTLVRLGGYRSLEQPVPDRHRRLAADRLCHGPVFRLR